MPVPKSAQKAATKVPTKPTTPAKLPPKAAEKAKEAPKAAKPPESKKTLGKSVEKPAGAATKDDKFDVEMPPLETTGFDMKKPWQDSMKEYDENEGHRADLVDIDAHYRALNSINAEHIRFHKGSSFQHNGMFYQIRQRDGLYYMAKSDKPFGRKPKEEAEEPKAARKASSGEDTLEAHKARALAGKKGVPPNVKPAAKPMVDKAKAAVATKAEGKKLPPGSKKAA